MPPLTATVLKAPITADDASTSSIPNRPEESNTPTALLFAYMDLFNVKGSKTLPGCLSPLTNRATVGSYFLARGIAHLAHVPVGVGLGVDSALAGADLQ